jgi:hypothetical protein
MSISTDLLMGVSFAAGGLVSIIGVGLSCMSRSGLTLAQSRLVARHMLYGAGLFILFVASLALGPTLLP